MEILNHKYSNNSNSKNNNKNNDNEQQNLQIKSQYVCVVIPWTDGRTLDRIWRATINGIETRDR